MVRIVRMGWDDSLGPYSQVIGRNGDSWDSPPVERERENPNVSKRKRPKAAKREGAARRHEAELRRWA